MPAFSIGSLLVLDWWPSLFPPPPPFPVPSSTKSWPPQAPFLHSSAFCLFAWPRRHQLSTPPTIHSLSMPPPARLSSPSQIANRKSQLDPVHFPSKPFR